MIVTFLFSLSLSLSELQEEEQKRENRMCTLSLKMGSCQWQSCWKARGREGLSQKPKGPPLLPPQRLWSGTRKRLPCPAVACRPSLAACLGGSPLSFLLESLFREVVWLWCPNSHPAANKPEPRRVNSLHTENRHFPFNVRRLSLFSLLLQTPPPSTPAPGHGGRPHLPVPLWIHTGSYGRHFWCTIKCH